MGALAFLCRIQEVWTNKYPYSGIQCHRDVARNSITLPNAIPGHPPKNNTLLRDLQTASTQQTTAKTGNLNQRLKMNLALNINLAEGYTSNSQIARLLTENWVLNN